MELTSENYYSRQSAMEYLSVSQIKSFIGCPAVPGCEERALAELTGEYIAPVTDALLIGSLVDVLLTGTDEEVERFSAAHPEMYSSRGKTVGQLKSQYAHAYAMVDRAKRDSFFMRTLEGRKQVILTGELFGHPCKAKLDVLGDKYITDLKTTKSINQGFWDKEQKRTLSFVEAYLYDLQAAVYVELVRQNTGKTLPFFLSVISKESEPDIEVINIDYDSQQAALEAVRPYIDNIVALKNGESVPTRCGHCEWCRRTKVLTKPISWLEIGGTLD